MSSGCISLPVIDTVHVHEIVLGDKAPKTIIHNPTLLKLRAAPLMLSLNRLCRLHYICLKFKQSKGARLCVPSPLIGCESSEIETACRPMQDIYQQPQISPCPVANMMLLHSTNIASSRRLVHVSTSPRHVVHQGALDCSFSSS